jgi:hypothetical protein
MPLSEKELARFLWEQPDTCQARGLTAAWDFFALGRRYQRVSLGPYGVAQQVSVRFWPAQQCYYAQVIVFTTGTINTAAYLTAKRQLSALRQLLERTTKAAGATVRVVPSSVLIGRQVQMAGDLLFALNLDTTCQAFTYAYDAEGLQFENVGKQWHYQDAQQHPALATLGADLLAERADALSLSQAERADWLASTTSEPGEYSSLVITAGGVVEQADSIGEGEPHE